MFASPVGSTYSKSGSSDNLSTTGSINSKKPLHNGLRKLDTIDMIEEDLEIDPVVL